MFRTPFEPRRPQRSPGEQVSETTSTSSPVLLARLVVSMPHGEHKRHFGIPASGRPRSPFLSLYAAPHRTAPHRTAPHRRALAELWRCQLVETRSAARHVTPVPRWWADLGRRAEERNGECTAPRSAHGVVEGLRDAHADENHIMTIDTRGRSSLLIIPGTNQSMGNSDAQMRKTRTHQQFVADDHLEV